MEEAPGSTPGQALTFCSYELGSTFKSMIRFFLDFLQFSAIFHRIISFWSTALDFQIGITRAMRLKEEGAADVGLNKFGRSPRRGDFHVAPNSS